MFITADDFKTHDSNKMPYSFSVERHCETENLRAGVTEQGFSLKAIGNRFILNTPEFKTGRLDMDFKFTFDCKAEKGYIAIDREVFMGELVIGKIGFKSDESFDEKEIIAPTEVSLPMTNGGDIPYIV